MQRNFVYYTKMLTMGNSSFDETCLLYSFEGYGLFGFMCFTCYRAMNKWYKGLNIIFVQSFSKIVNATLNRN